MTTRTWVYAGLAVGLAGVIGALAVWIAAVDRREGQVEERIGPVQLVAPCRTALSQKGLASEKEALANPQAAISAYLSKPCVEQKDALLRAFCFDTPELLDTQVCDPVPDELVQAFRDMQEEAESSEGGGATETSPGGSEQSGGEQAPAPQPGTTSVPGAGGAASDPSGPGHSSPPGNAHGHNQPGGPGASENAPGQQKK